MCARTSSSPRRALVRAAFYIIAIGAIAAVIWSTQRPRISEADVRRMIESGELVGMPADAALKMLHHERDSVSPDARVDLPFDTVRGWSAGPVRLELERGRVARAYFLREAPPEEE